MKAMLLCCLLAAHCACAGPLALPAPPVAAFAPRPDTALPLNAALVDEGGRPIRLGALFGHGPVVLVPGYYTCPNLCSTLFEGVLQALALSGLDAGSYQLAGVSIDPAGTPAQAAARKLAYAGILPGNGANLHLLTGRADAIAALSAALRYRYSREPASGQLAHAAGFVVATADGRVARYFPGVRFDPAALRVAVEDARRGATGGIAGQLLLLCAHYNPATGRYSLAALSAVRITGALVLIVLLGSMWRRRAQREAR
jgi:protein SCO1/2